MQLPIDITCYTRPTRTAHRTEHVVTLHQDVVCAGARTVSERLVMRYVSIAVLLVRWTAGRHLKMFCPVHSMSKYVWSLWHKNIFYVPCVLCWLGSHNSSSSTTYRLETHTHTQCSEIKVVSAPKEKYFFCLCRQFFFSKKPFHPCTQNSENPL